MMNRYVSRMNRQQARDQKHGRIRIPFNLQLFAEDGADGGDDGSDDGDDAVCCCESAAGRRSDPSGTA